MKQTAKSISLNVGDGAISSFKAKSKIWKDQSTPSLQRDETPPK